MCPPVMAVGNGITDDLRFQVYLAPLCVQRQVELDSSVGISQGHIPDTTSASWPESLDRGREQERQVLRLSPRL